MKTRVRQLANGKWVAEAKKGFFGSWEAIDKRRPMRTNPAHDYEYSDGWCDTRAEAQALIPHFLAHWGY